MRRALFLSPPPLTNKPDSLCSPVIAESLNPKEVVTLEELAISNMYEIGALIELLEQKGIVTKQEILETIQELRRKTPHADAKPSSKSNTRVD